MSRFVTQAVTAWAACWTFSAACFWAFNRLRTGGN
jgi:hypothetical protein